MAAENGRDRLRELLDVIVDSLAEPRLSGADVAGRAFLSRFHFDRLVAAATGEAPGALRRRLLLERAADQLADGRVSVTAAALAAGYRSPEAFSRAFRQAFGSPPGSYRRGCATPHLPAPNGIHFHPPGGLRVPGRQRRSSMDITRAMIEHDGWLIGQLLDRAGGLDAEILDRPITISVDAFGNGSSLRELLTYLVWRRERWNAAVEGRPVSDGADSSIADLIRRHAVSGPRFAELTSRALAAGRADDTFIDATCDPPRTFSYGGMIAHVLTFSAQNRALALGVLESAGMNDLGYGDPTGFVTEGPGS